MRRRDFIKVIGGAATWPLAAYAQQAVHMRHIGILLASLGRPGGNITGLTYIHNMLAGKSVELLKETVLKIFRVAVLWNPNHLDPEFQETQRASGILGVQLQSLEVREPKDFDGAFQAASREGAEALIVLGSRLMFLNRQRAREFRRKEQANPRWSIELADGGRSAFVLRAQHV